MAEWFELVTDMNPDKWIERIYGEADFGTNIAIAAAGGTGLTMYLYGDDLPVAGFVAMITFPIVKVLASAAHSYWNRSRERSRTKRELKELFDKLGHEEMAVVQGFVSHGGSVITWSETNLAPFSRAGIESLMNRELIYAGVSADGTETFVLDTQLFDYAQEVLYKDLFG